MMIEVRDLKKKFGPLPVLQGVTFSIEKGEAISIIGVSGGGKSVLLKHLVGLLTPDSGEVSIDGQNIAGLDERELMPVRRKFGMLFQGAALFDSMTVEENVAFVLNRERKSSAEKSPGSVEEVLDLVGFSGIEKKSRPNCPAACASGWAWPGPSFTVRKFFFTTSPPPAWIRLPRIQSTN